MKIFALLLITFLIACSTHENAGITSANSDLPANKVTPLDIPEGMSPKRSARYYEQLIADKIVYDSMEIETATILFGASGVKYDKTIKWTHCSINWHVCRYIEADIVNSKLFNWRVAR